MDLTEKQLTTKEIFKGTIITVQLDTVELPNGKEAHREVVRHPGGVAVLALTEDKQVYMVRQYRYPMGYETLELPAGKLDGKGESVETAGRRELAEETGLTAETMTYLGASLASPGFTDEVLHMYLAEGLTHGESHPDEDEFLNLEKISFAELVSKVMSGEIIDGKTISTTLKTKVLRNL